MWWALEIQGISYKIEYWFKKKNIMADTLSQTRKEREELQSESILMTLLESQERQILWRYYDSVQTGHCDAKEIIWKLQQQEINWERRGKDI